MGQSLPTVEGMTPAQMIAWIIANGTGQFLLDELRENGWMDWYKIIWKFGNDGRIVVMPQDTTGRDPVVEQSGAAHLAAGRRHAASDPRCYSADGTIIADSFGSANGWIEMKPVLVTADANGNMGAAADILAAIAGYTTDIELEITVDTNGSYILRLCQDPTGAPGATAPDIHTGSEPYYLGAYHTHKIRIQNLTDNVGFGYDAGVNGNVPNNANILFTGRYRKV